MPICAGQKLPPLMSRFMRDEDGNITLTALGFMAAIGILSAIAWDLNSHEYHRAKLQKLADRAVLAAADLDQAMDPAAVVRDYFDKAGYPDVVSTVTVDEGLNFRTVSVQVDGLVESTFLGGDYYGGAVMSGDIAGKSEAAAQKRFDDKSEEDLGKTFEEILQEEIDSRTRGDGTTLEQAKQNAQNAAAVRIATRNNEILARDAENENRIGEGLPPLHAAVKDEFLSDQEIRDSELYQATKNNGPYLSMGAFSEAEERVNNVEISMVLDISGSKSTNNKLREMRDAASLFVDSVINDSTEDLVSISIIPYSEHVSAGPEIMSKFSVQHVHNYSHCIEFSDSDFDTTTMGQWSNGNIKTYEQVQHFY